MPFNRGTLTIEQRIEKFEFIIKVRFLLVERFSRYVEFMVEHNRITEAYTIRRITTEFETTGSVIDQSIPVRRRNARSNENIAVVRESVSGNPSLSISRRSQELGFPRLQLGELCVKTRDFIHAKLS